jgi:Ca2+-binding RTX toxin-like protein
MRRTSFRPEIEILESRLVPAVGLSHGVLTIDGGSGGDTIVVSQVGNQVLVTLSTGSPSSSLWTLSKVKSVIINGGVGNDTITCTLPKNVTINGGDGNDTITATVIGRATISGGAGNDTITCTTPAPATITGDDGDDTITSSGTGWSKISGGSGADIIVGSFGKNYIDGGYGADSITGRGILGDKLRGGADLAVDTLTPTGGPSTLYVEFGVDLYTTRPGDTVKFV